MKNSEPQQSSSFLRKFFWLLFVVYVLFLYSALVLKYIPFVTDLPQVAPLPLTDRNPINITPFSSIKIDIATLQARGPATKTALLNLIGNILIFVPFGFILPPLLQGRFRYLRTFLSGFIITLSIELLQLICSIGIWDIDDILLNLTGLLLGMLFSLPIVAFRKGGQNTTVRREERKSGKRSTKSNKKKRTN